MARKSLRKAMILLMELIILAIFKAQANVFTPPALSPPTLPIHLLQSSQPSNHQTFALTLQEKIKHDCSKKTFESCKDITKGKAMVRCVKRSSLVCIEIWVVDPGIFAKIRHASKHCGKLCISDRKVVGPPQLSNLFVNLFEWQIRCSLLRCCLHMESRS